MYFYYRLKLYLTELCILLYVYNGSIDSKLTCDHAPSPLYSRRGEKRKKNAWSQVNSKPAHFPRPFFHLFFPTGGHLTKKVIPGVGHSQNNSVLRTLKVAYGLTPTCANICTIVFTCKPEMTERRTCTVREKVIVLAVQNRFELLQIA